MLKPADAAAFSHEELHRAQIPGVRRSNLFGRATPPRHDITACRHLFHAIASARAQQGGPPRRPLRSDVEGTVVVLVMQSAQLNLTRGGQTQAEAAGLAVAAAGG